MTPSQDCFAIIKRFEGCELAAYPDPGTGGEPWTIGYGHTGPEVHFDSHISQDIADAYLVKDVAHAADAVERAVTVELTQCQFDALVSIVYNVGTGSDHRDGIIRLRGGGPSTLLRKTNEGDIRGAGDEFLHWTHAGGVVMKGLMHRREAERSLFLS